MKNSNRKNQEMITEVRRERERRELKKSMVGEETQEDSSTSIAKDCYKESGRNLVTELASSVQ